MTTTKVIDFSQIPDFPKFKALTVKYRYSKDYPIDYLFKLDIYNYDFDEFLEKY